jgi:hypothetical protein
MLKRLLIIGSKVSPKSETWNQNLENGDLNLPYKTRWYLF